MRIMFTVVALGPVTCYTNGTGSQLTTVNKKRIIVDYICVPHDIFSRCKYFNVVTVQEITDQFALHGLLGERSRLPDHSVLLAEFECDISSTQVNLDAKQSSNDVRYKTKNIPPHPPPPPPRLYEQ